jgi:rhamnose transport system permease protein
LKKNPLKSREMTLLLILIAFCALVTIRSPVFLSGGNLSTVLNDSSALVIVSLGQFMVIMATGGIDLSVSAIMAFTGMVTALMNQAYPGFPAWIYLPMGLLMGALLGGITGSFVAFGGIPPLMASLGAMSVYRGLVFVMSNGAWVTTHEMTPSFLALPTFPVLGIPSMIWIMIIVSVIAAIFVRFTSTGREFYALGGNKTAALFAGVREKKVEIGCFLASGLAAGLAGVLWVSRYGMAHSETASGFDMQTVAACVLGGVSMSGGSGTALGVLIGALFFGLINNALTVTHISPFYQTLIQGFVILFAIVSNTLVDRRTQIKLLARRRI